MAISKEKTRLTVENFTHARNRNQLVEVAEFKTLMSKAEPVPWVPEVFFQGYRTRGADVIITDGSAPVNS